MNSQQFKQARLDCGLTQAQMADLMGMPQPAICRIESGSRQPTHQQAATVALILRLFKPLTKG